MKVSVQIQCESKYSSSGRGFTLVDLVTVLAVLCLVGLLSIPALARSKGITHRAQCAANLKQFALAHQLYAAENSGLLPLNSNNYWTWDVGLATANAFTQWVSWRQLYCPGTSVRFSEDDNLILWGGPSGFAGGGLRVIGYGVTLPGSANLYVTNVNTTLIPSGNLPPNSSQRVLIADATISGGGIAISGGGIDPNLRYTYNYTELTGGFHKPHLSAHLDGRFPVGGNLAMLDGHVEWREFEKMIPRSFSSGPVFWW